MQLPSVAALRAQDPSDKAPSLMLGLVGAVGGALVVGLLYGVVGRLIGEYSYAAVLVGAASGFAAATLGRGTSIPVGIAAGVSTIIAMVVGKLIIGPLGPGWVAAHTTLFDIIFCWLAAPAVALALGGVPQAAKLVRGLRSRFGGF